MIVACGTERVGHGKEEALVHLKKWSGLRAGRR